MGYLTGPPPSPYNGRLNKIINGQCNIDQLNEGAVVSAAINGTFQSIDGFSAVMSNFSAGALLLQQQLLTTFTGGAWDIGTSSVSPNQRGLAIVTNTDAGLNGKLRHIVESNHLDIFNAASNATGTPTRDAIFAFKFIPSLAYQNAQAGQVFKLGVIFTYGGQEFVTSANLSFASSAVQSLYQGVAICPFSQFPNKVLWASGNNLIIDINIGGTASLPVVLQNTWKGVGGNFGQTTIGLSTLAGTFLFTDFVLQLPGQVLQYTKPGYVEDLIACQRYFEKSFVNGTAPASNAGNSGVEAYDAVLAGVNNYSIPVRYQVPKFSVPVVTTFNPGAAGAAWRNITSAANSGAATINNSSTNGFTLRNAQAAGDAAGNNIGIHWIANARLS